MKKYVIFIILLLSVIALQAQTQTDQIAYTQKDYYSFMKRRNNFLGFSLFYDLQNFPNAANKHWMSNMQSIGTDMRCLWYPLLLDVGWEGKHFGKISSTYQIPAFQSAKLDKSLGFVALSVFPLPYIPVLKRTQEYIAPYAGIGYQWGNLVGSAFGNYDRSQYKLNLSSWYWKIGGNIFLGDFIPFDLFVEYIRTINPDKIRNSESIRIGITFRYMEVFGYIESGGSKKSSSKPLIQLQ